MYLAPSRITQETVAKILKKRRKHAYKLNTALKPTQATYDAFIQFEEETELKRIKKRKQAGKERTKLEHDKDGLARLYTLYEQLVRHYPTDVACWLRYIDFAQRTGANSRLSSIFGQAVARNPQVELLWVLMASWQYQTRHAVREAVATLLNGRRVNPKSSTILGNLFRLFMRHHADTEKMRAAETELTDEEAGFYQATLDEALGDALEVVRDARRTLEDAGFAALLADIAPTLPSHDGLVDGVCEAASGAGMATDVEVLALQHDIATRAGDPTAWEELVDGVLDAFTSEYHTEHQTGVGAGAAIARIISLHSDGQFGDESLPDTLAALIDELPPNAREAAVQAAAPTLLTDPDVVSELDGAVTSTTAFIVARLANTLDADPAAAIAALPAAPVDPLAVADVLLAAGPTVSLSVAQYLRRVASTPALPCDRGQLLAMVNTAWVTALDAADPAEVWADVSRAGAAATPATVAACAQALADTDPAQAREALEAGIRATPGAVDLWVTLAAVEARLGGVGITSVYNRAIKALGVNSGEFEARYSAIVDEL